MKAVILCAGVGSRIRPLTDDKPKPLVVVAGKTILGRMIDASLSAGVSEFVVVTGYRAEQIKQFLTESYPGTSFTFVHNDHFEETNTGYSVLLAEPFVRGEDFIKFDGDVVFEDEVLNRLIADKASSALCIDTRIRLEAEEVKVILDENKRVLEVGKKLDPTEAHGESIGIEKICTRVAPVFFQELHTLMQDTTKWQEYYDDTYTTLVVRGVPMHAVDITGLKWVEIDTHEDFDRAELMFRRLT